MLERWPAHYLRAVLGVGNLNMRISGFGHALFGIAVAGLAILSLVFGDFAPILEPFPALLP